MPHIVVSEGLHARLAKMRNDRSLRSIEEVIEKLLGKNVVIDAALDELQYADDLLSNVPTIKEAVAKDFAGLRMKIAEMGRKVV